MDIWQHIIRPGDVWGRFTLYLKQNGQAAVQREVVRSLRLRVRDVVLDLGGGGRALAQLALYSGAVYGVAATAAAVSAATVRNRHDVARGRIRICRGAFPALPFPAEMFHVITAFEPAFWAGDLSACLRPVPPHAAGRVPGGLGPGLLGGTLAAFAGGREKPSSLLPMPVKRLRRSRLRSAAASGRRPCARGLFPHAPILSPARFFR